MNISVSSPHVDLLKKPRRSKAFTMLELIVVIVILGILAAIAIPTFGKIVGKSKNSSSKETLSATTHNVQALLSLDSADANSASINQDFQDAIGEVTYQAAAPGFFAAGVSYTATADSTSDATQKPVAGEMVYVIPASSSDPYQLRLLGKSGGICAIAFNSSAAVSPSCSTSASTLPTLASLNAPSPAPTSSSPPALPAGPANFHYSTTAASRSASVHLTWSAASGNGYYVLERSAAGASSAGPFTLLATTGSLSYDNTTGTNANTTYYYRIKFADNVDSSDKTQYSLLLVNTTDGSTG